MRAASLALLVGRLMFGGFFLLSAWNHFANTDMLAAAAASRGTPLPGLAVLGTGLLLLVGGASVLAGAWPRLGLALLALFLLGVTPVMHAFWTFDDPVEGAAQLSNFAKNVALLGASLGLMAVPTPWAWSLDAWRAERRGPAHRASLRRRPYP